MTKTCSLFFLTALVCISLVPLPVVCGVSTPAKGELFPQMLLTAPEGSADTSYLGLKGKKTFNLSDIKADLIILEIFSMYCPYCQREAPLVNELFDAINRRTEIKDRVKLIGVGAGNTGFEVGVFKKQYKVQFPLLPDETFSTHKAVGEVRTPYFFVLKKQADGSRLIIYSKVGSIRDADQFLSMILEEASLH